MQLLSLANVTKTFGKFKAVDDVSFNLNSGEIFGFIGPNGAGKSTTIRMIIGALNKSSGKIYVDNLDIDTHPKYIENISYVPGDVNLWGNLTGMEIINFFMAQRHFTDKEERDRLIKVFKLDANKKSKTYSKGNRQKVALISALLSDADILIFDEPTTGLDPLMERVFHNELIKKKNQGKSVVLSSHILSEVEKLADRIAIIKDGKIIESGKLSELRHITRTKYLIQAENDLSFLKNYDFVHDFEVDQGVTVILVDNDHIKDFFKRIRTSEITHLATEPLSLESIFLRYYEDS
ncbi:MAG TPA: ABC transporter ATP-binding protein [Jeotgalicoccus sp.]|nr:ABC transporter ATP-binding protein [Jeotgalicoccus sp.]